MLHGGYAMDAESAPLDSQPRKAGRPKLGGPRRFRITTTIEPAKLALIREHAKRVRKSLGQLADDYVAARFGDGDEAEE